MPSMAGFISGATAGLAYTFVRKLGTRGENSLRIVFYFSLFSTLLTLPFFMLSPVRLTDHQLLMLLLCGAELVVYAICALQYAPANTSPIVAAGGLLAIIAQIFQWIGLVQLCLSRRKVKDRDCHEIWAKLRGSSCLCAALLAVAACGCLLRQGWLLAAGYAMDALLAYAMYRKIKGLTFSLLPGDGSTFTED